MLHLTLLITIFSSLDFRYTINSNINIANAICFFFLFFSTVLAVYKDHYPEFVQYLYLFAPISLGLLNPSGFLSMEIQKGSDAPEDQQSRLKMMWRVVKGKAYVGSSPG